MSFQVWFDFFGKNVQLYVTKAKNFYRDKRVHVQFGLVHQVATLPGKPVRYGKISFFEIQPVRPGKSPLCSRENLEKVGLDKNS